jgi:hypothetical protein
VKRALIEWAAFALVASAYALWQKREEILEAVQEFDDDFLEQARYKRAVMEVFRSIRKLPETEEDS